MLRAAALLGLLACAVSDVDPVPETICGDGTRDEFETCDDGNRIEGDGCSGLCNVEPLLTVTWAFYPSVTGPAQTDCRAGVAQIELVTSINTTQQLPCNTERTGKIFVPHGKLVFARLVAENGDIIASSLPELSTPSAQPKAAFYEDAGFLRASYTLRDLCNSGTPAVELTMTPATGTPVTQKFPCELQRKTGLFVTTAQLAGTYDLVFKTSLGTVGKPGIVIGANNAVTDVDFVIP